MLHPSTKNTLLWIWSFVPNNIKISEVICLPIATCKENFLYSFPGKLILQKLIMKNLELNSFT